MHIELLQQGFNTYVKEDMSWKKKADPVIDLMANLSFLGKAIGVFIAGVASIIGILKFIFHIK